MALVLTGIRKSFSSSEGRTDVLRGVDLRVSPGETVALTGERHEYYADYDGVGDLAGATDWAARASQLADRTDDESSVVRSLNGEDYGGS